MKIRNGFVSNSSSSSFIIVIDEMPTSIAGMISLLFDDDQVVYGGWYGSDYYPVSDVAARVMSELKEIDFDEVVDIVSTGYIASIYDEVKRQIPTHPYTKDVYKKQRELQKELAHEYVADFITKNKLGGKKFFYAEFSDNDGTFESDLEHGDLFAKLPCITVSNH